MSKRARCSGLWKKARTEYGVWCTVYTSFADMHDKKANETKRARRRRKKKTYYWKCGSFVHNFIWIFSLSSLIIHCLMATNSAQDVRCLIPTKSIQFKFICNMHAALCTLHTEYSEHWIQYTLNNAMEIASKNYYKK